MVHRRALGRLVAAAGEQPERRPAATAAAPSSCRSSPRRLPCFVREVAGPPAAGRASPGRGPSSRSCTAWRARSSRSPRRARAGCPSSSRPRRGRRSTCPSPAYAGCGRAAAGGSATVPTASTPGGRSRGTKTPRAASYSTRAPACASREYAGWRRPTRRARRNRASPRRLSTRRRRPRRPAARRAAAGAVRRSTTRDDLCTPARARASTASSPRSSALTTTARSPGRSAQSSTSRRTAAGQHHAGEVVPGKDERLLDRPRRRRRSARPGSGRASCPRRPGRGRPRRSPSAVPLRSPRSRCSSPAASVDDSDGMSFSGGGGSRSRARLPTADHEHLDAAMLDLVPAGAPAVRVDSPEAGDVAKEALVQRPRPPRPDHRLVVEADRGERPAELVDDAERVDARASPGRSAAAPALPRAAARRRRGRSARRRPPSGSSGSCP